MFTGGGAAKVESFCLTKASVFPQQITHCQKNLQGYSYMMAHSPQRIITKLGSNKRKCDGNKVTSMKVVKCSLDFAICVRRMLLNIKKSFWPSSALSQVLTSYHKVLTSRLIVRKSFSFSPAFSKIVFILSSLSSGTINTAMPKIVHACKDTRNILLQRIMRKNVTLSTKQS